MCGRFLIADDEGIDEIDTIIREAQKSLGLASQELGFKTGEIFPTNRVPIASRENGQTIISVMHWGFPIMGSRPVINARAETVKEKRMFSKAFNERRCVIASTGFYEWTHVNGRARDKLLFNEPGSRMLYMAGIAAKHMVKGSDAYEDCFVILTRQANSFMSDVHNRMPVILRKNEINRYIGDDSAASLLLLRDNIELGRKPAA